MGMQKNILIDDDHTAVICDFGLSDLSRLLNVVSPDMASASEEIERYKAHELFYSRNNRNPTPSYESDVYSLGCVIHEVRTVARIWYGLFLITIFRSSSTTSAPLTSS
jgi:serine/threonine protein kinase